MAKYETMLVTSAALDEEASAALIGKFKSLIEANGTIDSVDDWGKRRLAYPINDEEEGVYSLLNKIFLPGRLVADPELRHTPQGVSVTTFTIAVDRSFVRQGEQRQADFIDIVCWRSSAEFVCKYFQKGSLIAVNGSIQTRT